MQATARAEQSTFDIEAALSKVQVEFPLPSGVTSPEIFHDVVTIQGVSIQAAGLSAVHPSGRTLTGAAAELGRFPLERAYFELFERSALIDASSSGKSFVARDLTQRAHGILSHAEVFPARVSGVQRYALSSGVAVQRDWASACGAAAAELVERDHVLRCWYGETRPEPLAMPWSLASGWLDDLYEFRSYRFPGATTALTVVGLFGFPRGSGVPLVFGFAARSSVTAATDAAFREALQQLAFGWGEPVEESPPEVSASPEFHLDFYNYAGHQPALRAWLEGAHFGMGPRLPKLRDEYLFVDLTPDPTDGKCRVVKALNATAVPLCFGVGHPWFEGLPEPMLVHPIA